MMHLGSFQLHSLREQRGLHGRVFPGWKLREVQKEPTVWEQLLATYHQVPSHSVQMHGGLRGHNPSCDAAEMLPQPLRPRAVSPVQPWSNLRAKEGKDLPPADG